MKKQCMYMFLKTPLLIDLNFFSKRTFFPKFDFASATYGILLLNTLRKPIQQRDTVSLINVIKTINVILTIIVLKIDHK